MTIMHHRLKILPRGIGNAIYNAIESRVPSSFRMNRITFTWGFLGVILKNRVKTKTSEGKIDRSRFPNVLRWFLTLLVTSQKIFRMRLITITSRSSVTKAKGNFEDNCRAWQYAACSSDEAYLVRTLNERSVA